MTLAWDIIELLGGVAGSSWTGMLLVAALGAAPLLPLAALLIQPWRHLAFGVAIFASVLWAGSVALILASFERLGWSDRVAFGAIFGLLPIAFVWVLGFVAAGMFRAGIASSVLWVISTAALSFVVDMSQPWRTHVGIAAFVGLLPTVLAGFLGWVVLGTRRRWPI